jgi:histidinol-phosphate/aromatic aminotransferase/cobyric acid decarboxylase-like protein
LTGAYLRITIGTPAQMAKLMGALAAILGGRAPHKKGKT